MFYNSMKTKLCKWQYAYSEEENQCEHKATCDNLHFHHKKVLNNSVFPKMSEFYLLF